jgi:hypothetical protein
MGAFQAGTISFEPAKNKSDLKVGVSNTLAEIVFAYAGSL